MLLTSDILLHRCVAHFRFPEGNVSEGARQSVSQIVSEWGKDWPLKRNLNLRKHGYDKDDIEDGLDPAQQEGDAIDQLLVPTTITAVRHTCPVEWPALGLYY